ncbi:MAG: CCA tRNA nucleotidyltransferase [Elusimicrobia bacterium]|nr:CCA tRNA nucleotidyltransferase [Elusimicrobiota bacterium]
MNLSSQLKSQLPPLLLERIKIVSRMSESLKLKPYLVGGMVRDLFLNRAIEKDCDLTIAGGYLKNLSARLAKTWGAELSSYPQFKTFTLRFEDGSHIDLITTRKETYPFPGSLPLVKSSNLKEDLLRRDFSINAMAVSLSKSDWGELADPLNGLNDLKKKIIKVLHAKSFKDDPTRIFRAARFLSRFNFELDETTEKCLQKSIKDKDALKLSWDRIRVELEKIALDEKPAQALKLLLDWQILKQLDAKIKWNCKSLTDEDCLKYSLLLAQKDTHSSSFLLDRQRSSQLQATEKDSLLAYRLALLLKENSIFDLENFLEKLKFSKNGKEKILNILRRYQDLKSKKAITSLDRHELQIEMIAFFETLSKIFEEEKVYKLWQKYRRWCDLKVFLDGDALKKLGFLPGPLYGKIFKTIALKKYQGKLKSKEDEIRFAVDNFRARVIR